MQINQDFFASDNCSTVHPRIMEALQTVNTGGHTISYGDDEHTRAALTVLEGLFGTESTAFFVYNGTGANVIAIRSLLKGYESVLAPITAHIGEDECGSLEAIAGLKIEPLPHERGKIRAENIPACLGRRGFVHSVQPRLLSITQSNELGQVYSIEEVQNIGRACREHDLFLHVDGARIANAVASLLMDDEPNWQELSPAGLIRRSLEILAAITVEAGVHALSLGGTKNGLMFGEGIVLMNGAQGNTDLPFYRKQATQLASKLRYISVQFQSLYGDDLWIRNALHANTMARRLGEGIISLAERNRPPNTEKPGIGIIYPIQANALFVTLPGRCAEELRTRYRFYPWGENSYRLMCSWDTRPETVESFIDDLSGILTS